MTDEELDTLGFLYGELSEAEAESLEAALTEAPDLAEALEADAALLMSVRAAKLEESPPPGLARLAISEAERRPQPFFTRALRVLRGPAWIGLAGVSTVIVLFMVLPGASRIGVRSSEPPVALRDGANFARADEQFAESPAERPMDDEAPDLSADAEGFGFGSEGPGAERASRGAKPPPPSSARRPRRRMAKRRPAPIEDLASRAAEPPSAQKAAPRPRPAATAPPEPELMLDIEAPVDLAEAESLDEDFGDKGNEASEAGGAGGLASVGQVGQLSGAGAPRAQKDIDPNAGRQAEAARLLVQSALQDRARGRRDDARRALTRAAARAYRLPLLGEILLLRAEIELEDRRYKDARTYAERASQVSGFGKVAQARALAQRARELEVTNRN